MVNVSFIKNSFEQDLENKFYGDDGLCANSAGDLDIVVGYVTTFSSTFNDDGSYNTKKLFPNPSKKAWVFFKKQPDFLRKLFFFQNKNWC